MKNEKILNRIEDLERELRTLDYDNNGQPVDREAWIIIIDELRELEEEFNN